MKSLSIYLKSKTFPNIMAIILSILSGVGLFWGLTKGLGPIMKLSTQSYSQSYQDLMYYLPVSLLGTCIVMGVMVVIWQSIYNISKNKQLANLLNVKQIDRYLENSIRFNIVKLIIVLLIMIAIYITLANAYKETLVRIEETLNSTEVPLEENEKASPEEVEPYFLLFWAIVTTGLGLFFIYHYSFQIKYLRNL